jgi:hypothetical protein
MGAEPTTTDASAQGVDEFIHDAVFDLVTKGVRADMVADFPILGFPIVSTLFGGVLDAIAGRISTRLGRLGIYGVIDKQTGAERANFQAGVVGLHVAQASGKPETIERAREKFRENLGNLVHYDGSATP